MQFPGMGKPPIGVVFDSDMGESIDDALALALLYGFDGKNECRVAALSTSNPSVESASFCEVVGRFYAGAVSAAFAAVGRTLPVAMATTGKRIDSPMLATALAKKTAEGTPAYPSGIQSMIDTGDPRAVIRNALTAQQDDNAIVLLAGPATNLAECLTLPDFSGWAARKVRYLVMSEHSLGADVPAARKVLAQWPGQIVTVGDAVSTELAFPAASIEKDFAWAPHHPIVDAYRAFKPMPYDAPTWSMAAVLYAVRPKEGYFKVSDPGMISITDGGKMKFSPSADGKHRHLIYDPEQRDKILKAYTEVASAKPVVRQRFRPSQQQQQKPQEAKPSEAKPEAKPATP